MAATYSKTSPYYNTGKYGQFLDIMENRPISKVASDKLYTIDRVYHLKPQLLAFDLYKTATLWWVFAQRNPNVLKDPLFDFVAGTTIYVPDYSTIINDLGL